MTTIHCKKQGIVTAGTWDGIEQGFRQAQSCQMQQAWLKEQDPRFRPASVRVAWDGHTLFVYAELEDEDIFNPVVTFNELSYKYGDVFEMFLRPVDQDAYYEFHVTPQNQRFQLRIPSAEAFRAPKQKPGIPADWFINDKVIDSRVRVDESLKRWSVLASIPVGWVAETGLPTKGTEWLFSFSRYDYTRGVPTPVLSSTSPHTILNFHKQDEWGRLRFE